MLGRAVLTADGTLVLRLGSSVDDELVDVLNTILRRHTTEAHFLRKPYTYDQAAFALGVSAKWLQRRVHRGQIPYRTIGRGARFTGADIEEIRERLKRGDLQYRGPGSTGDDDP
jgi:excisionase family DNA binding protein